MPNHPKNYLASFLDQALAYAQLRADGHDDAMLAEADDVAEARRRPGELRDGSALLRLVREPIAWLLALAERLAGPDPSDAAAVARVRRAFHARPDGDRVRIGLAPTDVLHVLGLLMSALDPRVLASAAPQGAPDPLDGLGILCEAAPAIGDAGNPDRVGARTRCCCRRLLDLAHLL